MDTRFHRSMTTDAWIRLRRRQQRQGRWVSAHPLPRYQPSELALSYKPHDVSVSVGEA